MALHGLTSITFWVPGVDQVELVSPKHVPDDVIAAPAIPYTRTGKKPEIPVKRILQGAALACVADARAVDGLTALTRFAFIRNADVSP